MKKVRKTNCSFLFAFIYSIILILGTIIIINYPAERLIDDKPLNCKKYDIAYDIASTYWNYGICDIEVSNLFINFNNEGIDTRKIISTPLKELNSEHLSIKFTSDVYEVKQSGNLIKLEEIENENSEYTIKYTFCFNEYSKYPNVTYEVYAPNSIVNILIIFYTILLILIIISIIYFTT